MTRGARRGRSYTQLLTELESLRGRLVDVADLERMRQDLTVQQRELEHRNEELVESRRAIEESHERYADLFDLAPVALVTLDENGVICELNLRAAALIDVERTRSVGLPFHQHVVPDDRRSFLDYLGRLRRTTEQTETELRLRTRSGSQVRALLKTRRCGTNAGRAEYNMAIIDLREREQAEADRLGLEQERHRVLREQQAAEAANAAKDHFLAVLGHELRTPLTPLVMALEAAERRGLVPEPLRPVFEMVRRNVALEARLIDDLLDATRIRLGKLHLELACVDAHELIREVVGSCKPAADAAEVTLDVRLEARRSWLRADPDRIRQVFWNLLQNALRHTPRGGHVTVDAWDGDGRTMTIRVTDTGEGIAPGMIGRLFLPFEQEASSRRGLGLGLSICRGLVEGHGGRITASSPGLGRGATFEVELPTDEPVAAAAEPAPADEDVTLAAEPLTILLVEDNEDNASALSDLLGLHGFRVERAASVQSALERADHDFDVVVSDLGLPDGSGLDLMRKLRANGPVKAIALSGYGTPEDVRQSLAAGFLVHLTKPVPPNDLVTAIRKVAAA
jgi:PAS domain S-box-containing protein